MYKIDWRKVGVYVGLISFSVLIFIGLFFILRWIFHLIGWGYVW